MIVNRFMSEAEYECFIAGGKLMNATDHGRERGQNTNSVGFCFFTEKPDEAIHWLSGITIPELCVTLDIPDSMLTESWGVYRDTKLDDLSRPAPAEGRPTVKRKEYCCTAYSLADGVRVISTTDRYRKYADLARQLKMLGVL